MVAQKRSNVARRKRKNAVAVTNAVAVIQWMAKVIRSVQRQLYERDSGVAGESSNGLLHGGASMLHMAGSYLARARLALAGPMGKDVLIWERRRESS